MMTAELSTPMNTFDEAIARRFSPRAFTSDIPSLDTIRTLFRAAASAASCFNEQPWRFIVGFRGDDTWKNLLNVLVPFNAQWADLAPVLVLSVAKTTFANGNANAHAWHDAGQAAATMAIQASALGLQIHQMAGFDADAARSTFQIPENFEPVTMIAVGVPGPAELLPESLQERERTRSSRHPISDLVFTERWDSPLFSVNSDTTLQRN